MVPKRILVGFGATALFLGSLLGVACGDDETTNGDTTPAVGEPTEPNGAEEPTEPAAEEPTEPEATP